MFFTTIELIFQKYHLKIPIKWSNAQQQELHYKYYKLLKRATEYAKLKYII